MGALQGDKVIFAALAVLGALLSLGYMLRLFNAVFLGQKARWKEIREGTPGMVLTVVAFAVLSLLAGLAVTPLLDVVQVLVSQMTR